MTNAKLITISLATAALVAATTGARVQGAEPQARDDSRARQYAGSTDAWQHGYEHAYRDGADQGRQDRERRMSYNLRDSSYWGQRGYERAFGDRNQYLDGYRQGYQAGYDEAFYGVSGQYGQLYARPQAGQRVPAASDPYADRQHSWTDMAFDAGYREGVTLGQQDRARNSRSNYQNSATYRSGDMGYRPSYGDRESYRVQFRDGVQRGYEDGYGRSQTGGYDAGNPAREGWSNRSQTGGRPGAGSRNGQGGGGTFTVPANRQWTPTGIRVNQGDVLRFTSTGEIRFTGNDDRAGVAGSLAHRLVPGAPLPAAFAGALIGRIDNGLPFAIGDLQSITAPASGLLYLGTNDDNVSDNSGQFQVVISLGR
jgi:hypothetical protein